MASTFSSALRRFSRAHAWNWTREAPFLITVGVIALASGVLLVFHPFASLGARLRPIVWCMDPVTVSLQT